MTSVPTGRCAGPLSQVIVVAAVVLLDLSVRLDRQRAGDDVVQERPVVADQEHRPLVLDQERLQQLERLDVQVVGRLVQNQQVRRLGEELGQQQAAAFAAGEVLDQAARAFRGEQEILEVADDVPGLAVDRDHVVVADVLLDGLFLVERRFQLVEVGDLEPGAEADRPGLRGSVSPSKSRIKVVLPAALGPMIPTLSPRRIVVVRSWITGSAAVAEAHSLGLDRPACPTARPPAS